MWASQARTQGQQVASELTQRLIEPTVQQDHSQELDGHFNLARAGEVLELPGHLCRLGRQILQQFFKESSEVLEWLRYGLLHL